VIQFPTPVVLPATIWTQKVQEAYNLPPYFESQEDYEDPDLNYPVKVYSRIQAYIQSPSQYPQDIPYLSPPLYSLYQEDQMSQATLEPAQTSTQPPVPVPGPPEHRSPSTPEIANAERGEFNQESYEQWFDRTAQEEEDLQKAVRRSEKDRDPGPSFKAETPIATRFPWGTFKQETPIPSFMRRPPTPPALRSQMDHRHATLGLGPEGFSARGFLGNRGASAPTTPFPATQVPIMGGFPGRNSAAPGGSGGGPPGGPPGGSGGGGGGPGRPLPPTPPPGADMTAILRYMSQQQARFQEQMVVLTNAIHSTVQSKDGAEKKNITTKPEAYDGTVGNKATVFLEHFINWASYSGTLLNDRQGGGWVRNDERWIMSALSNTTGDAAEWASISVAMRNEGGRPFSLQWDQFVAAFRERFELFNTSEDAAYELDKLRQSGKTVGQYNTAFLQLMARTQFSDYDLKLRYWKGLGKVAKDGLINTGHDISTLQLLMAEALRMDVLRLRRAKEDAQYAQFANYRRQREQSGTPVHQPARINANGNGNGKSRDDFRKYMQGKCYGCGSTAHLKAAGHHERDHCGHCGRTGHQEIVCQDKFMGFGPRTARVAASSSVPTGKLVDVSEDQSGTIERLQKELAELRAMPESGFQ